MWSHLLLVVTCASLVAARETARWRLLASDGGHSIHLVDMKAKATRTEPSEVVSNVSLLFYTRNLDEPQIITASNIADLTNFDPSLPTVLLSHGWESAPSTMASIKDALLSVGGYNIISVDWSEVAANLLYPQVMQDLVAVGRVVAGMLSWMVDQRGLDLGKTHLAGHSLGGHLVGVIGWSIYEEYNNPKVAIITGLDPAGPGYEEDENIPENEMLDVEDAEYVQVIHTNAALLGMPNSVGNSDFYPNGGYKQAGCGNDWFGSCSHGRAPEYFAESVRTAVGFVGFQCDNWESYNTCYGSPWALMGFFVNTSVTEGIYYMNTATETPYALGFLG